MFDEILKDFIEEDLTCYKDFINTKIRKKRLLNHLIDNMKIVNNQMYLLKM